MAIVSLRICDAIIIRQISMRSYLSVVPLAYSPEPSRDIDRLSLYTYTRLTARLQKSWSVRGREAPDPAPVDPVLPVPDPAALRGPLAALRDRVARAAAQQEQGAGVRLIGFQPLVSREASQDRKSTRLNSSHTVISYAVFCLKKKKQETADHSAAL